MLTRLLPDQVSRFWDIISYSIEESLPPIASESPDKMNNILTSILCGKTQCWASYRRDSNNVSFEGIVLTRVIRDDASDVSSLLIYCLYGYEVTNNDTWINGAMTLAKYAKSMGCTRIVGYTNVERIIRMARMIGGDNVYSYISVDIDKIIK